MASPYLTAGNGSSRSPYLTAGADPAAAGTVPAAPHHGGGLLGEIEKYSGAQLVGNLAKDVGNTAVGVLPGIKQGGSAFLNEGAALVAHPIRWANNGNYNAPSFQKLVTQADDQYKGYYGPLAEGHVGEFGHNLYTHPLQPILDALTVASAGAGAAGKAGILTEDRAALLTRSPRAVATGKGPVITDVSSTRPFIRGRQRAANSLRNVGRAPATKPGGVLGLGSELKQYGKGVHLQAETHALENVQGYRPYLKATRGLKPNEWTALHIRAMGVHPDELKALWHGKPLEATINDPAVVKLVLEPSKRMLRAEPEAMKLSAQGAELLKGKGMLNSESETARPALLREEIAKLKAADQAEVTDKDVAAAQTKAAERLKTLEVTDYNSLAVHDYLEKVATDPQYAKFALQDVARNAAARSSDVRTIPGGPEPYYFPHTVEPQPGMNPLTAQGGGKGVPRIPGTVKQNLGILALAGKLHLRSDVLGPEFLRRVKFIKYDEIHNGLVRGAVRVTPDDLAAYGGKPPAGWEYVREKASTRIPFTMRGESTTGAKISDLIPNAEDLHDSQLAKDGFSTTEQSQAYTSGGHYYIVPKATVKAATGEFTRSGDFTRNFIQKPLSVWRSAVLGLRLGFLTNNLIGNSLMYAVKTGGEGALRNLFMAIMESHGRDTAIKLLRDPATPPGLRTDLMREFFPDQAENMFGRTQSPSVTRTGQAANKVSGAYRTATGALPRLTSKVAEEYPRRALIRFYIQKSPEFRRVYKALPKQTRTFEHAARQILEGKGGKPYQRMISKQVNQALGDYLHLGSAERNVLRNILPFYSWYKAIATTSYHLAVDTPLRANILAQLGRIGEEYDQQFGQIPSFLEGEIGLGHGANGTQRALSTQGMNPWATLSQLERGSLTDYSALGLNPFVQGPLDYVQHAKGNISPFQLVGSPLAALLKGLPPSTLVSPPGPSRLYPNRKGIVPQLYGFAGVPVKEYNPAVAAADAAKGR